MNLGHIHSIRAAILSAIGISIIAAVGTISQQPFLFPSLGPTIFAITLAPNEPIARFSNVIVGHFTGIIAAVIAMQIVELIQLKCPDPEGCMHFLHGLSAALAVAFTIVLQVSVHALHPPAAATTMLLVLGGVKADFPSFMVIMGSVIFVAAYGELIKHFVNPYHK